ncbi:MAG TPA: hypothetical protein VN700_18235 [Vicinamibacterales bacterium]|nr:hypothetical protein [Vicinamibacterales bacterium]
METRIKSVPYRAFNIAQEPGSHVGRPIVNTRGAEQPRERIRLNCEVSFLRCRLFVAGGESPESLHAEVMVALCGEPRIGTPR